MKRKQSVLHETCEQFGHLVDYAALAISKGRRRRTVFVFHAVSNPERIPGFREDIPFHRPTVFEEFTAWLAKSSTVTSSGEIGTVSASVQPGDPKCAVALTFDDGFIDHYTTVFPLLRQSGMTGTFFVPTDLIGSVGSLTRSMIREMSDYGMTIGSHSVSHRKLSQSGPKELCRELADSKTYLEDLTGRACEEVAYPYGDYSEMVKKQALKSGYRRAFASSPATLLSDTFAMPRIAIPETLQKWRYDAALYDAGRWRRVLRRSQRLDRFVHGTLGYNSERLHVPHLLR